MSYMISTGVNSGGSRPMYGIRSGSKESYAFPADVDSRVDIPVIFRTAFRAADLDFSFSPWNTDFLFAARASVNMVNFTLCKLGFPGSKLSPDSCRHRQIFLVFRVAL